MRYQYTEQTKDAVTKNRKYNSTIYPKIELSEDDVYIISNIGDRMDLLADKYYDDVTLWWIIAAANQIGKGSMNIIPGTNLRIPQDLEPIFSAMEILNTSR